jgi:hypothetical protein
MLFVQKVESDRIKLNMDQKGIFIQKKRIIEIKEEINQIEEKTV